VRLGRASILAAAWSPYFDLAGESKAWYTPFDKEFHQGRSGIIMLKKIVVLIVGVVFALVSLPALAAEQWAVIKDSKGRCSVRQVTKKTDKTIAGPFATKAEADKAKKEKCPPAEKKKK